MRLNQVRLKKISKNCAVLALLFGLSACGGGGGGGSASDTGGVNTTAQTTGSGSGSGSNPAPAATSSTTLSWSAPAARSDGSPLALSAIGGYRIYYGASAGNYTNQLDVSDPSATSFTVNNMPVGTYYFVMTTYDINGQESAYSPESSRVVN